MLVIVKGIGDSEDKRVSFVKCRVYRREKSEIHKIPSVMTKGSPPLDIH